MILTQLQEELIQEMVKQGATKQIINMVMPRLKTVEHQQEMMEYLISIRDKEISETTVVLRAIDIKYRKNPKIILVFHTL
ncbi:MAG: hypothetical protein IJX99_04675 [Clostridia bacterium]|nr:hypothetical protein [Clostridia bacterium]